MDQKKKDPSLSEDRDSDPSPNSSTSNIISISPIEADDVDVMVQIIRENLDPFEEAGTVLASAHRRIERFQEVYSGPGSVYLKIKNLKDSKIIGGAGLGPFVGLSLSEKIGEIRELVITPSYRGRGFGANLLAHCLHWARKFGYERLYLETTPQMKHAQKLFVRFDFRPVTLQQRSTESRTEETINQLPCYFMLEKT